MLFTKRLVVPQRPLPSGDPVEDIRRLQRRIDDIERSFVLWTDGLNEPGALSLSQTVIEASPIGASEPDTGKFTTLEASGTVTLTAGLNASVINAGTLAAARLGTSGTGWATTGDIGGSNDVAVSSATVTSSSYANVGDRCYWDVDFTINTIGSATGNVRLLALPANPSVGTTCHGFRVDSGFYGVTGIVYEDVNKCDLLKYDGTSILIAGARFRVSGHFRV